MTKPEANELWIAVPYASDVDCGYVARAVVSDKEMAAIRKEKPVRGARRAIPLNQPGGYWEEYQGAADDLVARMDEMADRAKRQADTEQRLSIESSRRAERTRELYAP